MMVARVNFGSELPTHTYRVIPGRLILPSGRLNWSQSPLCPPKARARFGGGEKLRGRTTFAVLPALVFRRVRSLYFLALTLVCSCDLGSP